VRQGPKCNEASLARDEAEKGDRIKPNMSFRGGPNRRLKTRGKRRANRHNQRERRDHGYPDRGKKKRGAQKNTIIYSMSPSWLRRGEKARPQEERKKKLSPNVKPRTWTSTVTKRESRDRKGRPTRGSQGRNLFDTVLPMRSGGCWRGGVFTCREAVAYTV